MNDCFFRELKDEMIRLRMKTDMNTNAVIDLNSKVDETWDYCDSINERMDNFKDSFDSEEEDTYSNEEMIDHINRVIDLCGFSGKIKAVLNDE